MENSIRLHFFPDIPIPRVETATVTEPVHYGTGNYVVIAKGMKKADYENYLKDLEKVGFEKFVDNGEGLANCVFSTTFTKGGMYLTVTHILRQDKTYISVNFDKPLSKHLFYRDSYLDGNEEGAKTTLYMNEHWWSGNSFVFRLKNGHFVISDGGMSHELKYLLDLLEELSPEGEKPIVEGWFLTHGHGDHVDCFSPFHHEPELAERIFVEGVYYNEPNEKVFARDYGAASCVAAVRHVVRHILRNTKGERPLIYRPQTGQRYYFNDITVDIVHCQEQLAYEDYGHDYNDSTTWCMFNVEGQKLLFCGDGEKANMQTLMNHYPSEYLNVDFMTLTHHSLNTWDEFTDYCTVKTLLATVRNRESMHPNRAKENAYLESQVEEWIPGTGDGAKVFEFPYKIGEFKTLQPRKWIYHEGQERPRTEK